MNQGSDGGGQSGEGGNSYGRFTARRQEIWSERLALFLRYQTDLAKWLLASLLVVNGGSLVALLNSPDRVALVPHAGPWFAAGVGASIASGFLAWSNVALHVGVYEDLLDPLVATAPEHFKPLTRAKSIAFEVTHWGAVTIGMMSLALAAIGAGKVEAALTSVTILPVHVNLTGHSKRYAQIAPAMKAASEK